MDSDILKAYRSIRRKAISRARSESRFTGNRFKADEIGTASQALAKARAMVADGGKQGWTPASIWAGLGGSDGKIFSAYGEPACRWFEKPESKGLRLVGLAHEVSKAGNSFLRDAVEHSGWYLTEDGWTGEKVCGVVYQLPGKNGRARYLYGYADPYNAGCAMLSINIVEGDRKDSDYEPDSVLRDVARWADGIAESMAEESREHDSAYTAGRDAREKSREALEACKAWTAEIRAFRDVWKARKSLQRSTVRLHLERVRDTCEEFREALQRARDFREESAPCGEYLETWRESYSNGI